ncbi:MAG: glycoside hydrolase family 32 protein [Planctomycetota bacterium]
MNDINGAIFWKGRYHIFYQHNPEGGYWKWMQWGHASSVDLVHWVHHPIALTPDLDGPDRKGCLSGGAFVNKEGVPTFVYHGVPDGMYLATADDDLLIHWTKHPANPAIKVPKEGEPGYELYNVYDPTAWIYNGYYYAASGNLQFLKKFRRQMKPEDAGDTVYLFKSKDAREFGVKLRCSPDGAEQTAVVCERAAKKLKIDTTKSTLDERIKYIYYRHRGALDRLPADKRIVKAQEAPFELRKRETLKLRIFLDRSVVEVFADGRQCITGRIYPTRTDSLGVILFSRGGSVKVKSVEAWDMAPANSY